MSQLLTTNSTSHDTSHNRIVYRGELYTCSFKEGTGSEQTKDRPVIVIQNDTGNYYSPTTIVAVITSQDKKNYPMHVNLPKEKVNLHEDSKILCEQLYTVDKTRLKKRLGNISDDETLLNEMDIALRLSIGLT